MSRKRLRYNDSSDRRIKAKVRICESTHNPIPLPSSKTGHNLHKDQIAFVYLEDDDRSLDPQVFRFLNGLPQDTKADKLRVIGKIASNYTHTSTSNKVVALATDGVARDQWNSEIGIEAHQPVTFRMPTNRENGMTKADREFGTGLKRPILTKWQPCVCLTWEQKFDHKADEKTFNEDLSDDKTRASILERQLMACINLACGRRPNKEDVYTKLKTVIKRITEPNGQCIGHTLSRASKNEDVDILLHT